MSHMLSPGLLYKTALLIHTHTAWEALQVDSLRVLNSLCLSVSLSIVKLVFGSWARSQFSLVGYFSSQGPFLDSSVLSRPPHLTE